MIFIHNKIKDYYYKPYHAAHLSMFSESEAFQNN